MPRRARLLFALLVALAFTLAGVGCGGNGDDGDEEPAVVETAPAATTSTQVKRAVFERSYSECASFTLQRIAAKYKVRRDPAVISQAVGEAWTKYFSAGEDAVARGRDGCLQGIRDRS